MSIGETAQSLTIKTSTWLFYRSVSIKKTFVNAQKNRSKIIILKAYMGVVDFINLAVYFLINYFCNLEIQVNKSFQIKIMLYAKLLRSRQRFYLPFLRSKSLAQSVRAWCGA